MSWSFSVPPTRLPDFSSAVDDAKAAHAAQYKHHSHAERNQIDSASNVVQVLADDASFAQDDTLSASISGHYPREGETFKGKSISISLSST